MFNLAGKRGYWALLIVGIGLLAFVGWRYINSFATVSFQFNPSQGSVQLSSHEAGSIKVENNQPLRLKKGEYSLSHYGKNVATESETIRIDGSWQQRTVTFIYTREYLAELHKKEQSAIESALLQRYPSIESLYKINGGALYGRGEYYGAALVFNDEKAEYRDRLHVLMQKKAGTWQVLSHPPTPILSAPDYPDVPKAILRAINQVK